MASTTPPPLSPPPDWVPARKTLILATTPRCGSTWIGDMIGATGMMGRPEEWFGWWRTERTREGTIAAAHDVIGRGMTPNGIAGVKLFPFYFEFVLRHLRFSQWFPDALWVHLVRRDLLGQAISFWRGYESWKWYGEGSVPIAGASPPPPEEGGRTPSGDAPQYDPMAIRVCLRQLAALEADWRAFFARTGITPISLVYEDVVADPGQAMRALADALGVTLPPDAEFDRARFAVQRDDRTTAIRKRFQADAGDPDRPFRLLLEVRPHAKPSTGETAPKAGTLRNVIRRLHRRRMKGQ